MKTMRVLLAVLILFCVSDVSAAKPVKKNSAPKPKAKVSLQSKLKQELYRDFEKEKIDNIFADERLVVDKTVLGIGITGGKPCGYFDPCFGLLNRRVLTRGLDFWTRNKVYFEAANSKYEVEAAVILGIIRVETNFGRVVGKRPVFNSLYSLYVLSAKKRDWALAEMKAFLRIAQASGWKDIFSIKGSTAGAFGIPQFEPTSYLSLAADGDGDGVIDLFSEPDAVVSIAKYLHSNHWNNARDEDAIDEEVAGKQIGAVHSYNHSDKYVDAVLLYADAIRFCISREPPAK